jgi:hypothetical protein
MIDRNLGVLLIPPHDRVLAADTPQAGRSHTPQEQPMPQHGASRGEATAESIDESAGAMNPDAAPAPLALAGGHHTPAAGVR